MSSYDQVAQKKAKNQNPKKPPKNQVRNMLLPWFEACVITDKLCPFLNKEHIFLS